MPVTFSGFPVFHSRFTCPLILFPFSKKALCGSASFDSPRLIPYSLHRIKYNILKSAPKVKQIQYILFSPIIGNRKRRGFPLSLPSSFLPLAFTYCS